MTDPLIDRDALAQVIYDRAGGDDIPDFTQQDCKQLADAAIAYLRTVITPEALVKDYGDVFARDAKPVIRAIFRDKEKDE